MSPPEVVTIVICVLVSLGTLVGVLGGLSRARAIVQALRPGCDLARSLATGPDPAVAFADRWIDLDAAFRAAPGLGAVWASYSSTVEPTTRVDGATILCSSSGPEDWFAASLISAGRWRDAAIARLAGLMVSLGILGTFLGLTLGLVEADFGGIQALSSGDARTEALQVAMFGLLAGSGTAFVTSVAGLSGSLVLTAVVRLGAGMRVDRALAETAAWLRQGIRVESADVQLARQLRTLAGQSDITAQLVPVLERLAAASAQRVPEDDRPEPVPSAPANPEPAPQEVVGLVAAIADLQASIDDMAGAMPTGESTGDSVAVGTAVAAMVERADALEQLVQAQQAQWSRIADGITAQERAWQGLEQHLGALSAALAAPVSSPSESVDVAALTAVLEQLEARLASGADVSTDGEPPGEGSVFEATTGGAAAESQRLVQEALAPTLDELAEVVDRFSAASRAFDTATSRLDAAARSNHDAADTLRQASDRLGGRLAVLQQSTAALRTGLAHHTDASSALTTAAATLQSVGPQLGRAADQIRLSASAMDVTADRLTALQQASGGADAARLVPALEALLAQLEKRS